jgi:hypothetical protein
MADEIVRPEGGPAHLEDKEIVALVAYLQRAGDRHQGAPPVAAVAAAPAPGQRAGADPGRRPLMHGSFRHHEPCRA